MFVQSLYNVVDTFWIARLSALAVGGLTIVFPLQMIFVGLGAGSGVGLNSYISRRFGAKDPESASHAASQVFFLAAALGCAVILVARSLTGPVLSLFGATDVLRPIASRYLRLVCFGAPFLFFNMMANNLFRAQGDALKPMLVMLTGAVTNIILDPLLIFGIGPFPALGVEGAAIATALSQSLGAMVSLFFLFTRTSYVFTRASAAPDLAVLMKVYAVGFPAAIMQLMMSMVITLFNHTLGRFGDMPIAAFGLDFRIMSLFFMPLFGLAQGLMPIVGFNFGAGRYDRLWEAVRTATLVGLCVGLVTMTVTQVFARPALSLISQDEELLVIAVPALKVLMLSIPVLFMQIIWIIVFQAVGKGSEALALTAVRQVIFLPPLLLVLPGRFDLTGVWMAMPLADAGGFLIVLYAIHRLRCELGGWPGDKVCPPEHEKKVKVPTEP